VRDREEEAQGGIRLLTGFNSDWLNLKVVLVVIAVAIVIATVIAVVTVIAVSYIVIVVVSLSSSSCLCVAVLRSLCGRAVVRSCGRPIVRVQVERCGFELFVAALYLKYLIVRHDNSPRKLLHNGQKRWTTAAG
jgi:hypothetical protein